MKRWNVNKKLVVYYCLFGMFMRLAGYSNQREMSNKTRIDEARLSRLRSLNPDRPNKEWPQIPHKIECLDLLSDHLRMETADADVMLWLLGHELTEEEVQQKFGKAVTYRAKSPEELQARGEKLLNKYRSERYLEQEDARVRARAEKDLAAHGFMKAVEQTASRW